MRHITHRNPANTVRIVRDTDEWTWELQTRVPCLCFFKRWRRHCYTRRVDTLNAWVTNCNLASVKEPTR